MSNRSCGAVLIMLLLMILPVAAIAQSGGSATLASPQLDTFPRIITYLDAQDNQGRFIHNLGPADIQIIEDEIALNNIEVQEIRPGAQVVIAFNSGPSLASRNSQGVSRFELLTDILRSWGQHRTGSTLDDWSLLSSNGPGITHVTDPQNWLAALEGVVQANTRTPKPSLDILYRAVDLAADPPARPGMGRAVLFITPPLDGDFSSSVQNLAARAKQQEVHISIWLIASPRPPADDALAPLKDLVNQTGGSFFLYTGVEATPNPEEIVEPQRTVYRLAYTSRIKVSGAHQILAKVQIPSGSITTTTQTFNLDIQPPNPAFISPPLKIIRRPPSTGEKDTASSNSRSALTPIEQDLLVLVDFPDGRVRPLTRTRLLVDNVVVAENTQPPFNQFKWDLNSIDTSGDHSLCVEAQDSLGLSGRSIETIVQVTIEAPSLGPWEMIYRQAPILAGLGVLLIVSIVLLFLILGGHIGPRMVNVTRHQAKPEPIQASSSPDNEANLRRRSSWVNRIQWPQRHTPPQPFAILTRVAEADDLPPIAPIPLTTHEVIFGSDPQQTTITLSDSSVDAIHARLVHQEEGTFFLFDENSTAGTWINYSLIPKEGAQLQHGDLIHIGKETFRISMRKPTMVRKPVITLLDETPEETIR